MEPKAPTLDQIAVFLAIVETGSFAAAGRKLGRATSAVSYAIANLESQLGLALFVRAGASKPRLTEAGRAILSDGRGLAMALDGLIAKARGLTQGLEAEVSLVVDVMLPAKLVVKALDEFRRKFPTVSLRWTVWKWYCASSQASIARRTSRPRLMSSDTIGLGIDPQPSPASSNACLAPRSASRQLFTATTPRSRPAVRLERSVSTNCTWFRASAPVTLPIFARG